MFPDVCPCATAIKKAHLVRWADSPCRLALQKFRLSMDPVGQPWSGLGAMNSPKLGLQEFKVRLHLQNLRVKAILECLGHMGSLQPFPGLLELGKLELDLLDFIENIVLRSHGWRGSPLRCPA